MKSNNSKKTLGKGLSAIFGDDLNDDKTQAVIGGNKEQKLETGGVLEISIDKIKSNKKQPRVFFEKDKLEELAESIRSVGIIEPIVVSKSETVSGEYEIIAGERRWRASQVAGLSKIPCVVKGDIGENLLEIMLIENIQREDLTPIEEARSYEEILRKKKITQEKLATILGKTRTYITNIIRLLKLPSEVVELVNRKILSVGHAKMLVGLSEVSILRIVKQIQEENLSVRELEEILRKDKGEREQIKKNTTDDFLRKKQERDIFLEEFAIKIQNNLKTKVRVLPINKKIGKIEIEYYNYKQLEDIENLLQ